MPRAIEPAAAPPKADVAAAFLVFCCYLLLSWCFYGRLRGWDGSLLTDAGGDAWSSVWFLHWWPWAIAHGHSVLNSRYLYAPSGYDLTWATPIPTASLLALPITLTLGAVVAFNVLTFLAPVLSAFSCYVLARRCVGGTIATSAVCGALFGFSSYELGALSGHLNLDLTFPVPVACLLVMERVRGNIGRQAFVAGFALTLLAEFGLSAEILASLVLFGSLAWLTFAALASHSTRAGLLRAGREMLLALVVDITLLLPWLAHMARSASQFPDFINPPWMYSTNLLNLVVPTPLTAFGGERCIALSARFSGNLSEQGGYIGLPIVIILLLLARERGREPMVAALLMALLGLIVASLGPSLHVGSWDTRLPLPWWLALRLPLLKGAAPARFSLYVALATALATALWQTSATTRHGRILRFLAVLGSFAVLLPDPARIRWSPLPTLPFFRPAVARAAFGNDANVLVLPYLSSASGPTPAMFWQFEADMNFRQAGGNLSFVPLSLARMQFVQHLMHNEPSLHFGNDIAGFVASNGVSDVVAGPGTSAALLAGLHSLGWPEQQTGGVVLFRVPPVDTLRFAQLSGEVWYGFGAWSLMGRSAEVTTHNRAVILHVSGVMFPTPDTTVTVETAGGATLLYRIQAHGMLDVTLPPSGRFVIRSGATFQPELAFPNNTDRRLLSFLVSLEPI